MAEYENELDFYQRRRDAKADRITDRVNRQARIEQLDAERQTVLNDMEDAGPIDFTKKLLKSIVVGGVRDGVVTGNAKLANTAGWAMERMYGYTAMLGGITPEGYQQGDNPLEAGREIGAEIAAPQVDALNVAKDIPEIPTMNDPKEGGAAAISENLSRSMVTFFTGYGPALKMMNKMGASRLGGDIYAGAVGDMLMFENKEGTFSDLARDLGFDNETTRWLSGELSDNEFDASMKAALEGAGMGASFWMLGKTFRALRDGYRAQGGMAGFSSPMQGTPAAQRGGQIEVQPTPIKERIQKVLSEDTADTIGGRTAQGDGNAQQTSRAEQDGIRRDRIKELYRSTVVRPGTGNAQGGIPGSFRRTPRRTGTGFLKDDDVQQYTLSSDLKKQFQKEGIPTPPVSEFQSPDKFHAAISAAKEQHPLGGAVHVYSPEEYANMRTFTTSDGTAGFAIKPDGDVVSVFNTKSGPYKGVLPHLLSLAIEQGGKKLDAFDIGGFLPKIYNMMGFEELSRNKWDPQYAPADWTPELGTPDVVNMELP